MAQPLTSLSLSSRKVTYFIYLYSVLIRSCIERMYAYSILHLLVCQAFSYKFNAYFLLFYRCKKSDIAARLETHRHLTFLAILLCCTMRMTQPENRIYFSFRRVLTICTAIWKMLHMMSSRFSALLSKKDIVINKYA